MSEEINEKKESFEVKLDEAGKLLEKLINPDITLSESVKVYKEGMAKLESAGNLLEKAKLEFQELSHEKLEG
jgi:exodeoxyribonuclease VII small subunit